MQFTLNGRKMINDIPSASGIEKADDKIYVLGDDSPWLFVLNEQFDITEKIQIGNVLAAVKGKIPKPIKPDLEAMAAFGKELLLFGSGSKSPTRDVLIRLDTTTKQGIEHSLTPFYDHVCTSANITRSSLNLEAALISNFTLYLFNRGNNNIYAVNINEFFSFLDGNAVAPVIQIYLATLPKINNTEAGFSGACIDSNGTDVIFTASVENTPNWIDDGEILGSFIGMFSLNGLNSSFVPDCVAIADNNKNAMKIKAEAIAVIADTGPQKKQILIATDNDAAGSEFLKGELVW